MPSLDFLFRHSGIVGLYCSADVAYNGYMEHEHGGESHHVALTIAHSIIYQGIASILIPYVVIHNSVHISEKRLFKSMSNTALRHWGPSLVALCIIPFLPIVDEPVEQAVDWLFDHRCPHSRYNDGCPVAKVRRHTSGDEGHG